jgi:hypothetical protein
MRKGLYIIWMFVIALVSCKDDDSVFDKSADERAAEAIATLKADLVAPANGWKLNYQPESGSGSFYVFMKFEEDNNVTIKTDLGANNGEFFEQTITYRIDNSLGLELIMESYSFFSFLFEQDQASFGAEYEFNFVNKTPDDALVFTSKTDVSDPTILVFEEAEQGEDDAFLGTDLSSNLNILADDLDKFTSAMTLTYTNKDLVFYLALDDLKRTVNITTASRKTNTASTQNVNFTSGYVIRGDSMVFHTPLKGTYLNNSISIKGIKFNTLGEGSLNGVCADPLPVHTYEGVTSANDPVTLATGLIDVNGKSFAQISDFYFSPLSFIFNNGLSAGSDIQQDIPGVLEMHLYYNFQLNDGTTLNGIGFVIENEDETITFALKEFAPVLNNNNLIFNFQSYRFFGDGPPASAETLAKIDVYLDALAQGDKTYVYEYADDIYEFYNPCTGWSFVFVNANR